MRFVKVGHFVDRYQSYHVNGIEKFINETIANNTSSELIDIKISESSCYSPHTYANRQILVILIFEENATRSNTGAY